MASTRSVASVVVAVAVLFAPHGAVAAPDALARRVAAAVSPGAATRVAHAALPPGFTLPGAAPKLPLLGSSWAAGTNPPDDVRVYYAASPATAAQLDVLVASLRARGYRRVSPSGFGELFVGDDGRTQRWCPRDYAPAVFVSVVGTAPASALDVAFAPSSAEPCAVAARPTRGGGAFPTLGNLAGLTIAAPARAVSGNRIESSATIRSALLQSDVLARLAARFAASGWRADPAVVEGETMRQRFTRAASPWVVEVTLDALAPGTYAASAVATASPGS